MVLGVFGVFQMIILLVITLLAVFYIKTLIKLWKSVLPLSNKILYTIIVIVFPFFGLLLLLLVHKDVLFKIEQVNSEVTG